MFNDRDNIATYKTASKLINKNATSAVERQALLNNSKLEKFIAQIDELAIDTWIEFNLSTNKKIRCKLSTKLDEADTFIFVNRLGLKNLEKTKEGLANDLFKKDAVILEQGLLIDRAMSAVTSSLKKKASA